MLFVQNKCGSNQDYMAVEVWPSCGYQTYHQHKSGYRKITHFHSNINLAFKIELHVHVIDCEIG